MIPATARGTSRSASARLSVSVRVMRSVVVSSQVTVDAAKAAAGAGEVVLDASGARIPVALRWERHVDLDAGASWVTVLPDGAAPLAVTPGTALLGR